MNAAFALRFVFSAVAAPLAAVSARAQAAGGAGIPTIIIVDPITVGAIETLGARTKPLLDTIITQQGQQISAATALDQSIGSVPAISLVIGRQEHIAGMRARIQDSLCRRHGVLPAWLVSVGPDQNGFTGKR